MEKKIIVAGHICLDITPVFPDGEEHVLSEILKPGKLIHMDPAKVHTGGVVANTGLDLKKMGADVRLAGKIGRDAFGILITNMLREYDADDSIIVDENSSTSYSVVLAPPGTDRIFLHNPGANDSFCVEDLQDELLSGATLFHFGYPPLMRKMYENSGESLLAMFQKVKSKGIATSLDLAMVDAESEAGQIDWKEVLIKVLPYVDFFVPSIEELCFMLEPDRYQTWTRRAHGGDITTILNLEQDIQPLAQETMGLGVKVLLLKCGVKGMYYRTADIGQMLNIPDIVGLEVAEWAGKEGFETSYQPERIRSGSGAGDASIAAFLYAMLNGEPLKTCVELAAAEGASCVEEFDTLSGVRTLEQLKDKIRKGWKKIC